MPARRLWPFVCFLFGVPPRGCFSSVAVSPSTVVRPSHRGAPLFFFACPLLFSNQSFAYFVSLLPDFLRVFAPERGKGRMRHVRAHATEERPIANGPFPFFFVFLSCDGGAPFFFLSRSFAGLCRGFFYFLSFFGKKGGYGHK
ncbi:hypothetical protein [Pandoravirus japonicus]|uniref:Uncharacterized protein n=1 Tax=Pandoravirus japonicus TaxID=2823154 RepID=A0A811BQW0_9VIRU|nr:hypothetical protein [Pandoravirus japonicus]